MSQAASPRRRRTLFPTRWLAGCASATADLLFPPCCAFCDEPSPPREDGSLLCESCARLLSRPPKTLCPRCGIAAPEAARVDGKCPECRDKKYAFRAVRVLGPYENDIRQAVLRIKHREQEHLAMALGRRLAAVVGENPFPERPQLVAPVPMYWLKRLLRGTSAAETLSRTLAAALSLPQAADLLSCNRWTKKQSLLHATERLENVRGAFAARRSYDIAGARILLVDDVITTGATCDSAAKALLKAGAECVYAVSIARGSGMRT